MARSKKLEKNLSKVQDMLDGKNDKIQVGYGTAASEETRKVGDTWTDSDGYEWEQKEGFKVKKSSLPATGIADTCPDCESFVTKPWDKDSYKWNGRCYYCQIDYESKFNRDMFGTKENAFNAFKDGTLEWNKMSKEEKEKFLNKNMDEHSKYLTGRVDNYLEGFKKEQKVWKEEMKEGNTKLFDKSVANALANANVDTTNVKLKNNTK